MDPGQELQHLTCTKTPTLPCNAKEKKICDSSGHMVQVHHSPVDLCKSRFVISKWVHGSPLLLVGLLDLLTDSDFIDQWFSESCAYCWSSYLHTVPFSRLPWLIHQKEKKGEKVHQPFNLYSFSSCFLFWFHHIIRVMKFHLHYQPKKEDFCLLWWSLL